MVGSLIKAFWAAVAAATIATGLLLSFPSAWGSYWFSAWLAMGMWLLILRRVRRRYALAISILTALIFFLLLFRWVPISLGFSIPWIALALCETLFLTLWAGAVLAVRRLTSPLWTLWTALSFAGIEAWRATFPWTGMPWGMLGFSQVDSPLKGWIPLLGENGMAFLMVGILAALVSVTWKISIPNLVTAGLALLVVIASGAGLPTLPNSNKSPKIQVAAIQGGVAWPIEATYSHPGTILAGHLAQTRKTDLNGTQLILWGEQAGDIDPRSDAHWAAELQSWQVKQQIPLLFGTLVYQEKTTSNQVLKLEGGKITQVYSKREPVPFGEYLPARPLLSKVFPEQVKMLPRDMIAGKTPGIARFGPARVGANICFEVAVDSLVRDTIKTGANLLYFPTNNSSFGYSYQSLQQLQIARFRALEYDRSSAQVAVGGVSALITPEGEVLAQSGLFRADTLKAKLPLRNTLTWQARFGSSVNAFFRFGMLVGVTLIGGVLILLKVQELRFQHSDSFVHKGRKNSVTSGRAGRSRRLKREGKK
ncbi:apolipoprotein N-acyltransferase [Varibaculum vaginae]|uniref:apolipoprotein N-acyltransferase n=1 Tax=Varibaculum vaginae TaxID=2364797 RepID=UPI000F07A49C|nr:apolipoprotein N-acyltransferase [Varibaculum vaginae]